MRLCNRVAADRSLSPDRFPGQRWRQSDIVALTQSGKLMPAVETFRTMKQRKQIVLAGRLAWACMPGLILCHAPPVYAQQAAPARCSSVAKHEYDAAKKQNLLRTRFGGYLRTGRIGRRQYWYCHA